MAAWDNVLLPRAPEAPSYAAPLLNFAQLGDLPKDYFEGTQMARTRALQTAFKEGLPRDPDGQLDIKAITDKLAKLGGADQAANAIKLQLQQQFLNQPNPFDQVNGGSAPAPSSAAPREPLPAHGIPSTTGNAQPANTSDVPGGEPARPGQNLTQPGETGYSVDYGPTKTTPLPQQTAQAQPSQLPSGVSEQAAANLDRAAAVFRDRANKKELGAQMAGLGPGAGKADLDQATDFANRAKQMRDLMYKNSEATTEQKNLTSGAAAKTEEQKSDIARGEKTLGGIQAQASQYERDLKPYLDLSRSILNDPAMYSGIGANRVFDINRVKAAFGNEKAAMMQAALEKITASSVLGQINLQKDQMQEAGAASSRIFSQQVDLVTKAAPGLANTLGGNRFLVEVSGRMGELSTKIRNMALDYKVAHGHLDARFDQQVSAYMQKHPVFSEAERSHPEMLGAPSVPPAIAGNKAAIQGWARSLGVNNGDPIRFPSGQVRGMVYGQPPVGGGAAAAP